MPYARKYNYKGIEKLWDNLMTILARDIPSELALINTELGTSITDFVEYLKAEKIDPAATFLICQPEDTDTVEVDDRSSIDEEHVFDILFAKRAEDDLEALTREILRRDRAVRNVLWSMTKADLCSGITCTNPVWDVRGGRLRWATVGNVKLRVMAGIKLVVQYKEIAGV